MLNEFAGTFFEPEVGACYVMDQARDLATRIVQQP